MNAKSSDISVLHVITTIERGGAENQLRMLVSEQLKLGIKVRILAIKGKREIGFPESYGAVEIFHELSWTNRIRLIGELKQNPPHIVHSHLPHAEVFGFWGSWIIPRAKFIITRHYGSKFAPRMPKLISTVISRTVVSRADQVVAISETNAQYLINSAELKRLPKVISYGISMHRAMNPLPAHLKTLLDQRKRILCVARLSPEKNLEFLIRAVGELVTTMPGACLVIVGEGDLRSQLETLVDNLRLKENVFLLGRLGDLEGFYRHFDVTVQTSLFEGFGLAILEAMAEGSPVLVPQGTALHEVVGRDHSHFSYVPGSTPDFVQKLAALIESDGSYGQIAIDQATRFSISKSASEYLELYEDLIRR